MTLTVEDGTGVAGAESYISLAATDAYWENRPHSALSAPWLAGDDEAKEGALREAAAYIDATWGPYYRGVRRGYVQGLLFPRTDAKDDAGYPLPDLPPELMAAEAELAARAVTTPLQADIDTAARIKREKVGPLETEYFEGVTQGPNVTYGVVGNLLAPILNGSQSGAPNAFWAWA